MFLHLSFERTHNDDDGDEDKNLMAHRVESLENADIKHGAKENAMKLFKNENGVVVEN